MPEEVGPESTRSAPEKAPLAHAHISLWSVSRTQGRPCFPSTRIPCCRGKAVDLLLASLGAVGSQDLFSKHVDFKPYLTFSKTKQSPSSVLVVTSRFNKH